MDQRPHASAQRVTGNVCVRRRHLLFQRAATKDFRVRENSGGKLPQETSYRDHHGPRRELRRCSLVLNDEQIGTTLVAVNLTCREWWHALTGGLQLAHPPSALPCRGAEEIPPYPSRHKPYAVVVYHNIKCLLARLLISTPCRSTGQRCLRHTCTNKRTAQRSKTR